MNEEQVKKLVKLVDDGQIKLDCYEAKKWYREVKNSGALSFDDVCNVKLVKVLETENDDEFYGYFIHVEDSCEEFISIDHDLEITVFDSKAFKDDKFVEITKKEFMEWLKDED